MDMKYLHIDKTGESHMEYGRSDLVGVSWYNLLHWDSIRTAYCKHQTVIQSDQERSSTALLRLQSRSGRWFWIHCVLQVKDTSDECQHPIIVCTNQVLSEKEADIMRASSWLYQYSSQTKFTYGVCPSLPLIGPQAQAQQQQQHQQQQQQQQEQQERQRQQQHATNLGYGPETIAVVTAATDYGDGQSPTMTIAYSLPPPPPHELELTVSYQPNHSLDDVQFAPWTKERPLVKQEPVEMI
ncbi:PREDICTED: neuronal PAS domain-containing protein 4-like [Ceratosolen solmsi marchali]|uniref:Neuronal PAS domain-containing protein 4-like n=1 Tax=Ceratosolen solmsi marchali TaxID=326594 RepID=A0AAJ7E1S9_9HYME|nr:PREDICTED: neuronal PAS domain-containing protein 4-like [Ceratosolen solmsi marchali]